MSANLVTGTAELVRVFFVHYLGPGELFSKSGGAQEEVGPKKYRKWISVKTVFTFLALNQLVNKEQFSKHMTWERSHSVLVRNDQKTGSLDVPY